MGTDSSFAQLFSKYGELREVTLVRDIVTGLSKCYAFVEFRDRRDCRRAQRETHKLAFMGKQILVDYQHQHTLPGWIPRRLGGGFGGRKESGQLRFGCIDRPWKKPVALHYEEMRERERRDREQRFRDFERTRRRDRSRDRDRSSPERSRPRKEEDEPPRRSSTSDPKRRREDLPTGTRSDR